MLCSTRTSFLNSLEDSVACSTKSSTTAACSAWGQRLGIATVGRMEGRKRTLGIKNLSALVPLVFGR